MLASNMQKKRAYSCIQLKIIAQYFQPMQYPLLFKRLVGLFLREIYTFIERGCIKLIKIDRKDIYNITKDYTI